MTVPATRPVRRHSTRRGAVSRPALGLATLAMVVALAAAVLPGLAAGPPGTSGGAGTPAATPAAPPGATSATTAVATFAAGCFWCVERDFDQVEGVLSTTSGYTGGRTLDPDYESVSTGRTGHTEALQVVYDPSRVSYERLLATFWRTVDPVDGGGQFCDRGSQYRPAIFVHTPEQRRLAEASRAALDQSGRFRRPVVVPVLDASRFTPAEPEHQDYHRKNPIRYAIYRHGCGRDQRLRQIWGAKPAG